MRMLDSVDVAHLPDGAGAYAGYTTGLFPTWPALKARFQGKAHLVSIAINAAEHALCLDVEKGDALPSQVPAWVKTEHGRNVHRPIVYASASAMTEILARLTAAGIGRDQVRLWSAHYGLGEHICGPQVSGCGFPHADGTQWRDDAPGAGGSKVDESLLAADFFTTPSAPPAELYGYLVTQGSIGNIHALTGHAVTSRDGGKSWT
jgi:hypothetical protein